MVPGYFSEYSKYRPTKDTRETILRYEYIADDMHEHPIKGGVSYLALPLEADVARPLHEPRQVHLGL